MSEVATKRPGRAGGRMKMKDLERATGVGRETIRYYIRQGLLPEPERPGRNVAWYDQSFVERLALIKDLQQKRFLPLQVIKAIVGNDATPSRAEVETLLDLDGRLPLVPEQTPLGPERLTDLARRTGLKASEVLEIAETGAAEITTRDGDQWVDDPAGIRVVELWGAIRAGGYSQELGFGAQNMRLYVDFVRWLAREELRLFAHGVTGKVDRDTMVRMAEIGIDRVNEILAVLRRATLLRFIAAGNLPQADVPAAPESSSAS